MSSARAFRCLVAVVLATVSIAACGGDDGGETGSGQGGIASLLARTPTFERTGDVITYTYGDLAAASELAGVDRPASVDSDDLIDWALAISGGSSDDASAAAVPLPEFVTGRGLADHQAFVDETGWSILDLDRFLEVASPPDRFLLIDGSVDTDAVEAAAGPARNDVWSLGDGDDFESQIDEVSPARPLGVPVRMAARDGLFATTPSTDMASDFVDGTKLGGDEGFAAVAARLDEADVYGAYLATMPERSRFDTIGLGVARDDDGDVVTIVYHATDEAGATDGVAVVESALAGDSARTGTPWKEIFPTSEVVADGANVVATLRLADDRSPTIIRDVLFVGDTIIDL